MFAILSTFVSFLTKKDLIPDYNGDTCSSQIAIIKAGFHYLCKFYLNLCVFFKYLGNQVAPCLNVWIS